MTQLAITTVTKIGSNIIQIGCFCCAVVFLLILFYALFRLIRFFKSIKIDRLKREKKNLEKSVLSKYAEVIMDYIHSQCDYAYLLDGGWGSGKTFFVNNELRKALENDGFKLIHVSLFGKTSVSQTNNETLLQVLCNSDIPNQIYNLVMGFMQNNNSDIGIAVDLISSLVSTSFLKLKGLEKEKLKSNFLYVFDDVERCDETVLPNILGEIQSQYAEKGYHVLLVGDESKLLRVKGYKEQKEKLIRHTLQFSYPDMTSLLGDIINTRENSPISKLYNSDVDGFKEFIKRVESADNIRTWLTAFDYYDKIVSKGSFGDGYPYYLQLFCQVFITTHYMRLNCDYFDEDKELSKKLTDRIQEDFNINAGLSAIFYSKEFYSKFETIKGLKYVKLAPIVDYIKNGFCDAALIKQGMDSYFHVLSPEEKYLYKAFDADILSRDELKECIDGILEGIKSQKYYLGDLIRISRCLEVFEKRGYLRLYENVYNYQNLLISAVDNISPDKVGNFFETLYVHDSGYEQYLSEPNFLKEAIEHVKLKYFNPDNEKDRFTAVFTNLDQYSLDDIRYTGEKGTIEKASEYGLFSSILNYSCKAIATLRYYLVDISKDSNAGVVYGSELPYLKKLREYLGKELLIKEFSKEAIELNDLLQYIDKTIKALVNTSITEESAEC